MRKRREEVRQGRRTASKMRKGETAGAKRRERKWGQKRKLEAYILLGG